MEDVETPQEPKTEKPEWQFQLSRVLVYATVAILYALVSFQRQCPNIVTQNMADTYGVERSELGVFSSIYFYPYGIIQIFAGLLSDVIEPAYVIGVGQLLAAIGAFICGGSKALGVGVFGRFLVGLGCGPTYVAVCRVITGWFKLTQLPTMLGLLVAIGGAGGIVASSPLSKFADKFGWQTAFYGIGGIGAVFSIICIIFVKGNPVSKGFDPVNEELKAPVEMPLKAKLTQLWSNLLTVISNYNFWLIVVFNVFSSGPYFDISGLWAGQYLVDALGYDSDKKGTTVMSFSIGLIIGSLIMPNVSTALKTRKWCLVAASAVEFFVMLVMTICGDDLSNGLIWFLFIVIGALTNPMTSVAYPLVREYYHPSVSATAVGSGNLFTFLSSAVYQQISSAIIPKYGRQEDGKAYNWKGYKYGLWMFCCISCAVSAIGAAFARDTDFSKTKEAPKEADQENKEEEKEEHKEDEGHHPSDEELDEL